MLSTLKTIDRRLARLEDLLIMVMMATLALVLGLGVVLRYVFNNPLTWSEEIVVTFFVWMVMLGVPSGLRRMLSHIRRMGKSHPHVGPFDGLDLHCYAHWLCPDSFPRQHHFAGGRARESFSKRDRNRDRFSPSLRILC